MLEQRKAPEIRSVRPILSFSPRRRRHLPTAVSVAVRCSSTKQCVASDMSGDHGFEADIVPNPRKRKRRQPERLPITARLFLDPAGKEDLGILSPDLCKDLFRDCKGASTGDNEEDIKHVAIAPWTPCTRGVIEASAWTILPVSLRGIEHAVEEQPHSSLRLCSSAPSLDSFLRTLRCVSPAKVPLRHNATVEIRICRVSVIGLDTIYVTLDDLRLEDGRRSTDVDRASHGPHLKSSPTEGFDIEEHEVPYTDAVRKALSGRKLVRAGDSIGLQLSVNHKAHHGMVSAKISVCEPVSQGLLSRKTRIVVLQPDFDIGGKNNPNRVPIPPYTNGVIEEDEESTSNLLHTWTQTPATSQTPSAVFDAEPSASEASGHEDSELSDNGEDFISMTSPGLPLYSPSRLSSLQYAATTPSRDRTNGFSTPTSAFSMSTTPTMNSQPGGARIFRAQGLLGRIPDEVLHPRPMSEDDEEARVYVDVRALVKIGCFSGDWVKLEKAEESDLSGAHNLGAAALVGTGDKSLSHGHRVAKIYGLPASDSQNSYSPRKSMNPHRRSSVTAILATKPPSKAYLSPILMNNVGAFSYVKISALFASPRGQLSNGSLQLTAPSPPLAKEVTLLKISTPMSLDRQMQGSLLLGLKQYFRSKMRLVKAGDLVGIPVDMDLGKALFQESNGDAEDQADELMTKSASEQGPSTRTVAWFRVGSVIVSSESESVRNDVWEGAACVDSTSTRIIQVGSEQSRLPATLSSTWPYYLETRRAPAPKDHSSPWSRSIQEPPRPYISAARRRLRELISAAASDRAIAMALPPLAILIKSTQRQIGKATTTIQACRDVGIHTFAIDAYDILSEGGAGGSDVKTEGFFRARAERALSCGAECTSLLVKHIEALSADRMLNALKEVLADARILIAATTEVEKISEGIRGLFTHEIEMNAPDEGEREGLLRSIAEDAGVRLSNDVDLSAVAIKTAALVAGDLVDVVDRAIVAQKERMERLAEVASQQSPDESAISVRDLQLAGGEESMCVTSADFSIAVDAARKNFADAIGAPKIPNVTWDDVGGLANVKSAVVETIQLPLERPELFAKGMKKRSGILFYGPPGTGKTLLAKAIATSFSLNFFSVKGPELLNMYIGESEANVRRVFQRARDARPCVVFFDELDSVAPKRGNQGDSGGVMDRIVSQLLAELDGMSGGEGGGEGVFVIGATNRPDLLDQALLRPGRFDKMLYLGISDTHEKQEKILEALTRKYVQPFEPPAMLTKLTKLPGSCST